jgi:hypothetical protein
MVESISGLLSGSIPQAIGATQTALTSLQSAAATLESTLLLITAIPFLPIEDYAPDISFSTALDDVSESLDAIPESLAAMEDTLNTTQGNLTLLAEQVRIISRNISELKSSINEIQLVMEQYQDVISTVQEKIDSFRSNLSIIITVTAWVFTIIFIWLGIAQLGLLTQGLERVDWPPSQQPDEVLPPIETELEEGQGEVLNNEVPLDDDSPPEPEP